MRVSPALLAALILTSFLFPPPAPASAAPAIRSDHEIVLEGGVVLPLGDLKEDFFDTEKGLGAETGFEVGFRFRYFLSPRLALSPAFHFVDFGNFVGTVGGGGLPEETLTLSTSVIRYGIDLQFFLPARGPLFRPFLSGGVALCRNRYREDYASDQSFYETAINGLGFAAGAGVRVGVFELSGIYHLDRFRTVRILGGRDKVAFNWDDVVVRVGLALPTR